MFVIWYFILKENIKKKKRKWEKLIFIECEYKVYLFENKDIKFIVEEI